MCVHDVPYEAMNLWDLWDLWSLRRDGDAGSMFVCNGKGGKDFMSSSSWGRREGMAMAMARDLLFESVYVDWTVPSRVM